MYVQVPRTVDVELTDDLVNSAMVGDMITVYGQVKVLATDETGTLRCGLLHMVGVCTWFMPTR